MTGASEGRLVGILHHGTVRVIPKGARADRVGSVPMRTPARIRTVDTADLPRACTINAGGAYHALHSFDGGLWLKVDGQRFGRMPARPGADGVLAYLEGREGAPDLSGTDLDMALVGTPLARASRKGPPPVDVDGARQVLDDAREECARAAASWAAERIVLSGGSAFVRSWAPMATFGEDGRSASMQRCLVQPFPAHWRAETYRAAEPHHLSSELQGYPVSPDAIPRTQAMLNRLHLVHDEGRQLDHVRHCGIPAGMAGDDDLVLMANLLPVDVLLQVRSGLRAVPAARIDPAVVAMRSMMMPYEVRGAAGLLDADDAETVIALARDLCAAVSGLPGAGRQPRFDAVMTWACEVALPRLRERGTDMSALPGDEEALDGLLPPGP